MIFFIRCCRISELLGIWWTILQFQVSNSVHIIFVNGLALNLYLFLWSKFNLCSRKGENQWQKPDIMYGTCQYFRRRIFYSYFHSPIIHITVYIFWSFEKELHFFFSLRLTDSFDVEATKLFILSNLIMHNWRIDHFLLSL